MARQCVLENTLTHLAIEYALEKIGYLTYSPIVSPLRKSDNILCSLNTTPLRKIVFQLFYELNLLDILNTNF